MVSNITTLILSCLLLLTTVLFVDAPSSKNKDTIFPSDRCEYFSEEDFLVKRAWRLESFELVPHKTSFCRLTLAAQPSNSACLPVQLSSRWYPAPFYNPVFPFLPFSWVLLASAHHVLVYELVGLPDHLLGLPLLCGQSKAATCGFAACKIRRTHAMRISHWRHCLLLDQVSLYGTAGMSFALHPSNRGKCSTVYSPTAKITQLSRCIRVIFFLHFLKCIQGLQLSTKKLKCHKICGLLQTVPQRHYGEIANSSKL